MAAPLHATLDQARQAPIPAGFRSAALMRHGSMVLRYDAPKGSDAPFAPAGSAHRFESFSADFGTRVVFCGPKGGDHG
jgi:hypothetical protein